MYPKIYFIIIVIIVFVSQYAFEMVFFRLASFLKMKVFYVNQNDDEQKSSKKNRKIVREFRLSQNAKHNSPGHELFKPNKIMQL